jgi:hypothetical protein
MKKTFFALGFFVIAGTAVAQQQQAWVCHDTVITDTIHYYYNKYYFKSGFPAKGFPRYKAAASTGTAVSHVGNKFENSEPLDVLGLEGFLKRHPKTATESVKPIVVRLYLADIDAGSGKPKLPPIDSVTINMMPSTPDTIPQGGNFVTVRRVNGPYAVLFRNMSLREGDTIFVLRTNGMTATAQCLPYEKHSDSYGYARFKGVFEAVTNYTLPGFGKGTDYEFALAPRVQYTLNASNSSPFDANDSTICTHEQVTFTSNASSRISDRFYNFIEFNTRFNVGPPFNGNATQQFKIPDEKRGIGWHFYSEDDKNYYLTPGTNKLVFNTDSAWKSQLDNSVDSVTCYVGNWYHAKVYGMNAGGGGLKFFCEQFFNYCTEYCNGDRAGLTESPLNHVSVFPNPATGAVKLRGLHGDVNVSVYSMTGQLMLSKRTTAESTEIDIGTLPAGNYLMRVSNAGDSRTLKILKN